MESNPALRELADRVSRICSEHCRLRERCAALESRLERLSRVKGKAHESAPAARPEKGRGRGAGKMFFYESCAITGRTTWCIATSTISVATC